MGSTGSAAREAARPATTGRRGAVVAALMLSMALALDAGTAPEATRRAIADAVHAVYLGAAGAAALAFLVLLFLAPRKFPVLKD